MNNTGFTKIPNAIIRMATITLGERSAWCLIASLPEGYELSVSEACAHLGIDAKAWRRYIAALKMRKMITVTSSPGHANVYSVTPAQNWEYTPAQKGNTPKRAPLPKKGTPPMPKMGRGTPLYNKEQLKNNTSTTRAHARERLTDELLADGRIDLAMMQHHITEEQYRRMVDEILADWQFRDLPESDYNLNHFSSVLRYKVADINNHKNGQRTDQNGDVKANTVTGFKIIRS